MPRVHIDRPFRNQDPFSSSSLSDDSMASQMESSPVNWETLDFLVMELAKSDNLVEDLSSSLSSASSSSYRLRLLVRRVRGYLESGEIDAAIDLLRRHAPALCNDHRLLFRLQKQKFIELLRKGTDDDRQSAIECLRTALAPCALDAYPEAYEEFKHALLALIYSKEDGKSPVADEWSEMRRLETAGLMSSVLRAHLQAYDPILSMTLRYLLSIHKAYCFRQGIQSPIADLTSLLLCEDRDPPGIPEETSYNASTFDEVDIQALAHAVGLSRQDAIDSLKFAKGDLFLSLQNELCRMKLDLGLLDQLLHEYCIYRGLVNEDQNTSKECSSSLTVDQEPSDANAPSSRGGEVEFEACSTSSMNQPTRSFGRVKKIRSRGFGLQGRNKRWKGRVEISDNQFEEEPCESNETTVEEESSTVLPDDMEHKYAIVLEIRELANKGMVTEIIDEINAMDPEFFFHHPILLFQLKQVEFLKCIANGDQAGALRVACSSLGPLSSKNPELVKPLKETLFTLLKPKEDAMSKSIPFAASLQVALAERFGIEEPKLMKIMRATLYSHSEWFRVHMCSDRFEKFLKIDSLKSFDSSLGNPTSKSDAENFTFGSEIIEDGGSPVSVSSESALCSESAILKVMEFLALARADAIHLLLQYNGNAETVIQQMFQ